MGSGAGKTFGAQTPRPCNAGSALLLCLHPLLHHSCILHALFPNSLVFDYLYHKNGIYGSSTLVNHLQTWAAPALP